MERRLKNGFSFSANKWTKGWVIPSQYWWPSQHFAFDLLTNVIFFQNNHEFLDKKLTLNHANSFLSTNSQVWPVAGEIRAVSRSETIVARIEQKTQSRGIVHELVPEKGNCHQKVTKIMDLRIFEHILRRCDVKKLFQRTVHLACVISQKWQVADGGKSLGIGQRKDGDVVEGKVLHPVGTVLWRKFFFCVATLGTILNLKLLIRLLL